MQNTPFFKNNISNQIKHEFPMTKNQLLSLKTAHDNKIKTESITKQINDISNLVALSAKEGKLSTFSSMNLPANILLSIKDDVIAGLKINFPDSTITYDTNKNVINIDWS